MKIQYIADDGSIHTDKATAINVDKLWKNCQELAQHIHFSTMTQRNLAEGLRDAVRDGKIFFINKKP